MTVSARQNRGSRSAAPAQVGRIPLNAQRRTIEVIDESAEQT